MNYEDIKRHFETFPPPQEVDWKPWAKITDTQLFLKSCYIGIRNFNGPVERCPAWWHLKDFYLLIKRTAAQPAAPSEQPVTAIEAAASEALEAPEEEVIQESVEV
ncbi:DUF6965 family protein [Flavobacterium fluviatile]|uniref:DUF6965 family protein n=1 Tax=Flavobacterium fluviatile TaxID=1862387 RepID=UPI001FCC2AB3|nr:hypothetical protein [Flavobacterium fluviatile]